MLHCFIRLASLSVYRLCIQFSFMVVSPCISGYLTKKRRPQRSAVAEVSDPALNRSSVHIAKFFSVKPSSGLWEFWTHSENKEKHKFLMREP